MTEFQNDAFAAGRLLTKALQPGLAPLNDKEYRALLNAYEADGAFRELFDSVARGMDLTPLSVDYRGAVLVPSSGDSLFALRLTDLRANGLKMEQKALMVLTHLTIAALFFPTAEKLFDDGYDAPPVSERLAASHLRDMAAAVAARNTELRADLPRELEPAWLLVAAMPDTLPDKKNQSLSTLGGTVAAVFKQLREAGLVRLDAEEESPRYTVTWRYIAQLRENTVENLFKAVRHLMNTTAAGAEKV
jgi:hypothetical protein